MKTLTLSLAIFGAAASFATASLAASDYLLKTNGVKGRVEVHSAAEVKQAFDLAAKQHGRQAIEISCSPATSTWCAGGFVAACDKNGGGMSSNDDGGVTCSLPQHD